MDESTAQALVAFTTRYCNAWYEKSNSWSLSEELYGVPSPCIISSTDDATFWQPQPFVGENNLSTAEWASDTVVQPTVHALYTTQFAGDTHSQLADEKLTLLQTWSEDDFRRVQENLVGYLATQKRLKLSLTLLVATQDNELDVISMYNLSGEVCEETPGACKRTVLAASPAEFLTQLKPVL